MPCLCSWPRTDRVHACAQSKVGPTSSNYICSCDDLLRFFCVPWGMIRGPMCVYLVVKLRMLHLPQATGEAKFAACCLRCCQLGHGPAASRGRGLTQGVLGDGDSASAGRGARAGFIGLALKRESGWPGLELERCRPPWSAGLAAARAHKCAVLGVSWLR